MEVVAWVAVCKFNCSLEGGFVRDWIVANERVRPAPEIQPSDWVQFDALTEQVHNSELDIVYASMKKIITNACPDHNPNEQFLFHGIRTDKAKKIMEQGFDYGLFKTHGRLGNGAYFADNAQKSHEYTLPADNDTIRIMFYNKVILDLLEAPIEKERQMDSSLTLGLNDPVNTNELESRKQHQHVTKAEYSPIGSSRKLNLLLQRSLRYSYRQRYCRCCPTILCELLFSLILIGLLALIRHEAEALVEWINKNSLSESRNSDYRRCPQNRNTIITTRTASGIINFVFQPITNDTNVLVERAKTRLKNMNCENLKVRNQNMDDKNISHLLQHETENTVIIDFSSTFNLKNDHNLDYNIMVRMPSIIPKTDPIDLSFLSFLHPSFIPDRSSLIDFSNTYNFEDSGLPEFSDVKMFIDSLLIGYQTNKNIEFELQREPIICTPYREDLLFESGSPVLITIVLMYIDLVYFIPYLILLISLIREKNAKVKEILKLLGIEPILNNFIQAIRTLIILCFLTVLLCIIFKLKLKPDAYFNTVNFGVLFIGYFIYGLQLISFCIMNAQLFDRSVRAVLVTLFIYGLSIFIYPFIIVWPTAIQYILIFLSPYIAGRSIFQQAILHEFAYKDVAVFQTIYRHVPIYFVTLIIMIVSCVFYWILSWYLEKVFPGEYGIPLHWSFLFKRDYWRSDKVNHTIEAFPDRAVPHKRTHSNSRPIVHVNHLVKKFGLDKIAVDDVSFDLYENQITSLLGPNGSGKTTIFNCLIGIYKQTFGIITIESENGRDLDTRTNMELLRKSIGYCPQHDILFDLLTVKEQIDFYAIARGFGKNKQQIASEMLRSVNIKGSQNLYCNTLSRGMKRRLSLACAFIGDTKIILLDEPSSGLDPSNRRLLWDWLRSMKEGKTLLLTTHFMEESDALSDRIMIIANGVIKADGTSAKLKEQYGSGYKLIINKQSGCRTNDIKAELRNYLPELKVETDISDGDVIFRTNQQPDNLFIQALHHLESMKRNNRIKSYGVQNTTMDDVFLKITGDTEVKNDSGSTSLYTNTIENQCRHIFHRQRSLSGSRYYLSQFHGLLVKTVLVRYRRWGLTLIILLLPILYNLLSNLTSQSQNNTGIFKMNFNCLNPQTIIYHTHSSIKKSFLASINGAKREQGSGNISEMNENIRKKRMDRPYTYTDIYLAFNIPAPNGDKYKIETLSSNLISGYEVISLASNTFYKHALNDTSASIQTTLVYKNTENFIKKRLIGQPSNLAGMPSCFKKILPTSLSLDLFVFYILFFYTTVFLISERKDSFLSLLNISGLHPASYWLFTYLFDIIISVIWVCYLLAIYRIFDVAFNRQPETKSSLQDVHEFLSSWDLLPKFYLLSTLIALPTLPFAYLLTKLFKNDILGGIAIYFILIIAFFISPILSPTNKIMKSASAQKLLYSLLNIICPTINAQVIITYILARIGQYCKIIIPQNITYNRNTTYNRYTSFFEPIGDNTIGWNIVILILHIVVFLFLLIIIDSGLLQFSFSCFYKSNFNENTLDDDVLTERHRVLGTQTHTFEDEENFLAVDHLTFSARRGEAFGLLGFNGAGKTTTFRTVVGDIMSTEGTAYIDGQNVRRRIRSTRHLGYCPQQDCSMDFLTVEDSLYLLARIRGVKISHLKSIVETMSSLFLLDPFRNNYIHQLSGGTKRRLHAAIALIGPPLVAILDEPTTGVDPNARQQMQEIFLNAVKAKLTIILTSHSMDECERVCNRLGIMVRGQLACLGTIQHLKSKFGRGYTIEIKVHTIPGDTNAMVIHNVQRFLLSQRQYQIEVKETTHSTGLFQCGQGTPAELFQLLEENKQQLQIETYTISQTTLEHVFLSFGKQIHTSTDE
ncbi:unnamed protein product [Adineta steineri]|uniref:ABC transporter domain-containing protein n=1 Tax=Adineta steineri TaxID=433720 RepID=A0A819BMT5_9BILA|nr:unnamed protein product [Adineta steineri]